MEKESDPIVTFSVSPSAQCHAALDDFGSPLRLPECEDLSTRRRSRFRAPRSLALKVLDSLEGTPAAWGGGREGYGGEPGDTRAVRGAAQRLRVQLGLPKREFW